MRCNFVKLMLGLFAATVFCMTGCGGGSSTPAAQSPATDRYIVSGKITNNSDGSRV